MPQITTKVTVTSNSELAKEGATAALTTREFFPSIQPPPATKTCLRPGREGWGGAKQSRWPVEKQGLCWESCTRQGRGKGAS